VGCRPPVLVGISLVGVRGSRLALDEMLELCTGGSRPIDRDVLILPEIVVENLSAPAGPLLKPTLDMVWNACGLLSSPYFDSSGTWIGGRR
jgi:hypothetical protein